MKKFSNKNWNKFVSKVDRYFTYETKYEAADYTSFHSYYPENDQRIHIFIGKNDEYGIFVSITEKRISTGCEIVSYSKRLTTFADINTVITMVKLIG